MTSPCNIAEPERGSGEPDKALSSSVARAQANNGGSLVGTPPLPQIPRRDVSGTSGSFQARTLAERSVAKSDQPSAANSSTVSGLGTKAALPDLPTSSALTASLHLDQDPVDRSGTPELQAEGTLTPQPDESTFSAVAGVPDEEKAKVLRRHLVSAEERGSSAATPAAKLSPAASPGPSSRQSVDAGESSVTRRSEENADDPFPIPYDAPGGDVT